MNSLIRIEMEFEDGTIRRLVGEDAQKWLELVNGPISLQQLRSGVLNQPLGDINEKFEVFMKAAKSP